MNQSIDAGFDGAVVRIVTAKNIMYGVGPGQHHIEVPADRDNQSVFGSNKAESCFYAIVENAKRFMEEDTSDPRGVFVAVAATFLKEFQYNFDTARWLSILNALIVGRAEHEARHGHFPVENDNFVLDYMDHGPEFTLKAAY